MQQFNKWVVKYLIYASPLLILGAIGALWKGDDFGFFNGNGPIYQLVGFVVCLWFALLTYYFFAIAFNDKLKDRFVRKIAGIKENDEREKLITGSISKQTFVSMVSVLVLLLFLSALRIHIYRASEAEVPQGRRGTITLGFGMDFLKETELSTQDQHPGRTNYLNYEGLPLSADGTILFILALELGIFFYFSRREFSEQVE